MKSWWCFCLAITLLCLLSAPVAWCSKTNNVNNQLLPFIPYKEEVAKKIAGYCLKTKRSMGNLGVVLTTEQLQSPRLFTLLAVASAPYKGVINPLYLYLVLEQDIETDGPYFEKLADKVLVLAGLEKLAGFFIEIPPGLSADEANYVVKAISSIIKEKDPTRLVGVILPQGKKPYIKELAKLGIAFYIDALGLAGPSTVKKWQVVRNTFPAHLSFYLTAGHSFKQLVKEHAEKLYEGYNFGTAKLSVDMLRLASLNKMTTQLFLAELVPERLDPDYIHYQDKRIPFYAFFDSETFRQTLFLPGKWLSSVGKAPHLIIETSDLDDAMAWVVKENGFSHSNPLMQISFQQDNSRFFHFVPGNDWLAISFIPSSIKNQKIITEKIEIQGNRDLTVFDVLARFHQKKTVSDQSLKTYVAHGITQYYISSPYLSDSFEIKSKNSYFFSRRQGEEWVEEEIFINGARWSRKGFPEVPFLESGQLQIEPAAIQLSECYNYRLAGEIRINERPCYIVAFQAKEDCPDLASGRIYIDKKTYFPMELHYSQQELEPPFITKKQSEWYCHFKLGDRYIFIPERIRVHESLKMAGYTVIIDKNREYKSIEINPDDYEKQRQAAYNSNNTMMRATPDGPRILKRDDQGNRVLQEEIRKHFFFLVGGLRGDVDSEYPVLPFAGVNYFDYDLFGRGYHLNVFSALIINSVTLSTGKPVFGGFFDDFQTTLAGTIISFTDEIYQDGRAIDDYDVDILPVYMDTNFTKRLCDGLNINIRNDVLFRMFSRADDNEREDFLVPKDDIIFSHGLDVEWSFYGFSSVLGAGYNWRSKTSDYGAEPVGEPHALFQGHTIKDYFSWYAKVRKDFHFHGLDASVNIGFRKLSKYDRFNLYDLGSGLSGIHGFGSGRVKADETYDIHLITGIDIAEILKWKIYYDGSYIHDVLADDYDYYHGLGCSFSFILFKSYICNFDYGYGLNQPTEHGKKGNHIFMLTFLKLLF